MSATARPGSAVDGIRRAGIADLDAIMVLETATFGSDAWSSRAMAAELGHEHTYYLVVDGAGETSAQATSAQGPDGAKSDARSDGALAYAGLLAPSGSDDADIQTIAVAGDARRTGLGRALMTGLIHEATHRGARHLFLEVRADNPPAQSLYDSLGFEAIAVRAHYYQPDDVDAIVMRVDLPREARS